MAILAGKSSSSVAAMLLLLLAVVVAGALPSGAHAQFNISNSCNQSITVSTGAGNVSLGAGTIETIATTAQAFLTGLVGISLPATGLPVPLPSIPIPTTLITNLLSTAFNVTQITISCSPPNCVTITATGTLSVLGLPLSVPYTAGIGPVCAPALP